MTTARDWAIQLHKAIPWIPQNVFEAWVTQENSGGDMGSTNNNPLGIGANGPLTYSSPQQGIQATSSLLNGPTYRKLYLSSQYAYGDPATIFEAIGNSPWNQNHYSVGCNSPGCQLVNTYDRLFGKGSANKAPGILSNPVTGNYNVQSPSNPLDALSGIPGAIGDAISSIEQFMVRAGFVLIGIVFAIVGLFLMTKDSQANSSVVSTAIKDVPK